jgi:SAM-dependent methyltransferase
MDLFHRNLLMKRIFPLAIRSALGGWWHERQSRLAKNALLKTLQGSGTQCNVCGWEGRAFTDDQWHPGTICPQCGSQVRHRILAAIFDGLADVFGLDERALLTGRDILHFAPERQLRERISKAAGKYVTADFERGDCDLRLDISAMPSVPDASFDVLIACDVLEHVPDDRAAMREISRVLRPGGTAILTVPQLDPPASTDEDPTVRSESAREKRFGQKDHVRMYGDDFADRLRAALFHVEVLTSAQFPSGTVQRLVLDPPLKSSRPLATNHRRIYFARKAQKISAA